MPTTPKKALRYPSGSASPQVPVDIQNLALDVENAYPQAMASGTITATVTASATGTGTITFPVGRFTSAPIVVVSGRNSAYTVVHGTPTTADVLVTVRHVDGTSASVSVSVDWIAIQE